MKILEQISVSDLTTLDSPRHPSRRLSEKQVNDLFGQLFLESTDFSDAPIDDLSRVFYDFIRRGFDTYPPIPGADPNDGQFHQTYELYPQTVIPTAEEFSSEVIKDHGSILGGFLYYIDRFLGLEPELSAQEAQLESSHLDDMGVMASIRQSYNSRRQSYLRAKEYFSPSGESED